ncbi:hypothetical protein P3S67_029285 [Capsicum chacoense]
MEIGKMTQLNVLDLSHNLLVGDIPPQLANLKVLVDLNLSHNGLSGHIPEELESTTGLQVVFLSYNELEGPIPNNKAFITASLQGNKGLCGNLTGFQPCERPSKHSIVKRRHELILITLLPVMGGLVLLYAFVGVLFMCDRRRRRAKDDGRRNDDGWVLISMLDGNALYRDILNATEEFDATFCIGQGGHGSVYNVNLPSLGTIAVKRLHSSFEINTHPKSFMNEVRALTGIKHRNIANLYGYCSYAQHSFLVYEYAERGSLSSILSNEVESKKLDWLKRLNIIKGVAFALSYMHQDCSPPIVHRDISSSNVLLDSKYEARVTDFGIAKLLKPDSSNFTALAGTYGYVALELAYTMKVTKMWLSGLHGSGCSSRQGLGSGRDNINLLSVVRCSHWSPNYFGSHVVGPIKVALPTEFFPYPESNPRPPMKSRRERGEPSYDDTIFEDLVRRFERPDSKNRWDSPLFELWPAKKGLDKSSAAMVDAVTYLTKKVDSKTRDVKILQPTIATQTARGSEANSLYEMDRATQEITNAIVEAQSRALGGPLNGVSLGPGIPTIDISRSVSLPELRRLRRTFIKLAGQTSLSGPPLPSDADSAKRMFVDYLNRELGSG